MAKWFRVLLDTLPGAALAAFLFLAGVGPVEAKSNLAKWARLVHVEDWPPWLTDTRAMVVATLAVALFYLWLYRRKQKAKEPLGIYRTSAPTPRIAVEIVRETRRDVQHEIGKAVHLWGLKISNHGAAADFQALVQVMGDAATHFAARRKQRLKFVHEQQRTARILYGAEDRIFFATVIVIPLYSDSIVAKGLWYFDEQERRDTDAQLVPTLEAAVDSPTPADFIAEFEVTIISEPPMDTPWHRLYRVGPGDEMHDITR